MERLFSMVNRIAANKGRIKLLQVNAEAQGRRLGVCEETEFLIW